jgi:hypothetical protein
MDYGQMIDDYDPGLDRMYEAFTKYFNNPTFTKIKDVNNHSMYMAKNYCLLSKECRYIVVFTNKDSASVGSLEELQYIRWISFQTRTLEDKHNLPPHNYTPNGNGLLAAPINRIKIDKESSTYSCQNFPITVTLLHTSTNSSSAYQDRGTVIAALETWNTIICLES